MIFISIYCLSPIFFLNVLLLTETFAQQINCIKRSLHSLWVPLTKLAVEILPVFENLCIFRGFSLISKFGIWISSGDLSTLWYFVCVSTSTILIYHSNKLNFTDYRCWLDIVFFSNYCWVIQKNWFPDLPLTNPEVPCYPPSQVTLWKLITKIYNILMMN